MNVRGGGGWFSVEAVSVSEHQSSICTALLALALPFSHWLLQSEGGGGWKYSVESHNSVIMMSKRLQTRTTFDLKLTFFKVIQPILFSFFFSRIPSCCLSGIIKSIHRCRHLAESSQRRSHCEQKLPKTALQAFSLPFKANCRHDSM